MQDIETRVENLEMLMSKLILQVNSTSESVDRLTIKMEKFSKEMSEYKQKVDKQIEEYRQQVDKQIEENRNNTKEYRKCVEKQIKEIRDNSESFKEYVIKESKDMKYQWGNLANKMGTLVEDIFYPSMEEFLEKTFKCKIEEISCRVRKKIKNEEIEIDILGISDDKKIFIIEIKSSPDLLEYIHYFDEKLNNFDYFFSNYKDYQKIKIYGGLNMNKKTINELTKRGIYGIVLKGDILKIVNFDKIN